MRIKRKVLSAILCLCLCLMPLEGVLPVYAYNEDDVFTDRETPETDSYFDHDDVQTANDYAEAEMFSSEQVFEEGTEILTEENNSGDLMTASDDSGYVFEGGGVLTVSSDSGTTAWRYDKQIGKDEVRRVILENGVKNIENSAFYNCINLESVDFSGCTDLETIDDQVFRGCGKLKSIDLSACKKLNRIGKIVFWECSELESVNLSGCSRLQIIDNNAFYKCTQLNSINFSGCSGLETIKNLVFWYCSSLTSIDLSDCTNLEAIGNQTFRECSELASIDLSGCSKLDSIDDQAFAQCIKLKELRLGGNSAPSSLGGHLFRGVPGGFHVHVPENASGYNASDWSPGTLVYGSVDLNSSKVDIVFLDSQNNSVTDAEYGEVITFRANVRDELQNTPASDGSVTFKAGTALSDTKQIVQGSAVSNPVTITGDSWKPGDYTIRAEYSGGTGLLPNDTANKLLTIKRAGRTISLSGPVSVNETDVTLNNAVLSEGKNDGTVQYGYSFDKDSQAVKNWQNSPVFTGLESGKTYYFFASVSEGTYYGKAVSSGVEVTIPIYEGIWVNNVNLLRDQDHTIACGNGTASFDPDTNVLTLHNATIITPYGNKIAGVSSYPFIWLNTTDDCTIVLEGENHIGVSGDSSRDAIMAECNLTITGPGSLEIEAGGDNHNKYFYGVHTLDADITMQDTAITMKNEAAATQGGQNSFVGVYAEGGGNINISKTRLNITDYGKGIGNGYEFIEIKNSQINITVQPSFKSDYGIYGLDIVICESNMDCTLPETEAWFMPIVGRSSVLLDGAHIEALMENNISHNAISGLGELTIRNSCDINVSSSVPALHGGEKGINIEDSTVHAVSTHETAVFSEGSLTISGDTELTAKGYYRGLQSNGDMTISGGKIDAVSSNDIGIWSRALLSIIAGEIHAKGGTGYAAIAARKVRTASEDAGLQINVGGLMEKNDAKTAFSDWYYDVDSGDTRNWSAFIPRDAEKLEVKDGAMQNASNEVWLAAGCTVTFNVNGGTGANTTVKVFPGEKVTPPASLTKPGYYLAGWSAENGSDFDITSTPVSRDMTLYAKWAVVSNVSYYTITASAGEHGTITPSGSISVREYTDQTFTFTPEEGYEAAEVLVDGKKVETGDFYKFERVTAGHTISVSFLKKVPEDYPDGTVAKPDGSFVTPDGVVILPDGTVILNDKDKTELKPDSDGNVAVVNKDGTVTAQDGSVRNPDGTYVRPAKPEIKTVQVRGNRVDISLNERTAGAAGYDYVIRLCNKFCVFGRK